MKDCSRPYRVLFRPFAKMVRVASVLMESSFTVSAGINSFVEPNFHVYEVHYARLDKALANFRAKLPFNAEEELLIHRCREMRISRMQLCEEKIREAVRGYAFLKGTLAD
jgi:hypothetical protein